MQRRFLSKAYDDARYKGALNDYLQITTGHLSGMILQAEELEWKVYQTVRVNTENRRYVEALSIAAYFQEKYENLTLQERIGVAERWKINSDRINSDIAHLQTRLK